MAFTTARAHTVRSRFTAAAAATLLLARAALAEEPPGPTPDPLSGIVAERDVTFATIDDEPLLLDIYRRADADGSPQPVLLFLHGGGWVSGSRRDAVPEDDPRIRGRGAPGAEMWPSMLPYVRRGVTLVTADYRLAPRSPEPAAIEDAFRALAWIGREGPARGLDPDRLAVAGVSAGGHLALLLGLTAGSDLLRPPEDADTPLPTIRGVIDLYGVADVVDLLTGSNAKSFTAKWIPSKRVRRARELSPLTYVHGGAPPVLVIHGDADAVVPPLQSKRLARALDAEGVHVELVTLEGAAHGWFDPREREKIEAAITTFLESIGLIDASPAS